MRPSVQQGTVSIEPADSTDHKARFLPVIQGLAGKKCREKRPTPLCRVMPFILTGMAAFLLLSALFSISPETSLVLFTG